MPARCVVHIGQQKSGTTYLQRMLHACWPLNLSAVGITYPLTQPLVDGLPNHQHACYGLLADEFSWVTPEQRILGQTLWADIDQRATQIAGTLLLSAEALSVIRHDAVHRFTAALNCDRVSVVITARHLGAVLGSSWQQHVRNGYGTPFPTYLDRLARQRERIDLDLETAPDMEFWRGYALGRLAQRWASAVGPDNVHVVTSPGWPADLLWRRFCAALGVPELADRAVQATPDNRLHSGLTAAEALVLAHTNRAFDDAGLVGPRARSTRELLIRHMAGRAERGPRVALPADYRDLVAEWNEKDVDELTLSGARVCGALSDLRYLPGSDPTARLTPEDAASAAGHAVAAMLYRTNTPPLPFARDVMRRCRQRLRRIVEPRRPNRQAWTAASAVAAVLVSGVVLVTQSCAGG
jgi:hypothetical protein